MAPSVGSQSHLQMVTDPSSSHNRVGSSVLSPDFKRPLHLQLRTGTRGRFLEVLQHGSAPVLLPAVLLQHKPPCLVLHSPAVLVPVLHVALFEIRFPQPPRWLPVARLGPALGRVGGRQRGRREGREGEGRGGGATESAFLSILDSTTYNTHRKVVFHSSLRLPPLPPFFHTKHITNNRRLQGVSPPPPPPFPLSPLLLLLLFYFYPTSLMLP